MIADKDIVTKEIRSWGNFGHALRKEHSVFSNVQKFNKLQLYRVYMEDIETNGWLIDRIEHLLQAYQTGLQSNKEKFEKFTDEYTSNLTNSRNNILTLIGLIATSIIGLLSANILDNSGKQISIVVLIVVLAIGWRLYMIKNRQIRLESSKLWEIEKTYLSGSIAQNFMKGFLNLSASDITLVQVGWLRTLENYLIVLEAGITANIMDAYKLNYPNDSFPEPAENLVTSMYNAAINTSIDVYKSNKYLFEEEVSERIFGAELHRPLYEFVKFVAEKCKERFNSELLFHAEGKVNRLETSNGGWHPFKT
jgi:ABC-type multidrug transport system fused ATPase/permease subunit